MLDKILGKVIEGIFKICYGSGVMQQKVGLGVNLPPPWFCVLINNVDLPKKNNLFIRCLRCVNHDQIFGDGVLRMIFCWFTTCSGMQNSAVSCVIVCILCIITAASIGFFGVWKEQVAACMVTGVMHSVSGMYCIQYTLNPTTYS